MNGVQRPSRLALVHGMLAALSLAGILGLGAAGGPGLFPRQYDIEWDEEVLLHDGRVVLVHVSRSYERPGLRLERHPEHPRFLGMSFRFEPRPGQAFEHRFVRGTLHFLDEKDGRWYIGYNADPGDPSVEIGARHLYPHVAILEPDGTLRKPSSWQEVPAEITRANVLPATPNAKVIAQFAGQRLSVAAKTAHWQAYPTGAGYGRIHRITRRPPAQGEEKK